MNSEVNKETPTHMKQVHPKYRDITTQITAKSIAMQRVRDHDHLKYLHLAGVVNAIAVLPRFNSGSRFSGTGRVG
jgi:hypothetical protein